MSEIIAPELNKEQEVIQAAQVLLKQEIITPHCLHMLI